MLVGAVSTLVQYALLVILVQMGGVDPISASMIGYASGALVNYWLNYSLTFASRRAHRDTFWRFLLIALSGFALNGLIMSFGVNSLQWHYLFAQMGATAIALIWNYIANRFWTFTE